jgi:hypothetical protein
MKTDRVPKFFEAAFVLLCVASRLAPAAVAETSSEVLKWAQSTKFAGDIRLRYQFEEKTHAQDRHRGRLRFRYGFESQVNDQIKVGLRLASGSADQLSSNQTFESTFSSKTFWLDRAYLSLAPMSHVEITGGKMRNPFFCSDLAWDNDVSPEGVAMKAEIPGKREQVILNAGAFPLAEFKDSSLDPILYGAQGGISTDAVGKKLRAAVVYYNFSNIKGQAIEDISPENLTKTNTLIKNGDEHLFAHAYTLIDANVEWAVLDVPWANKSLPLVLYGDYVQNVADDVKEDAGWLAGLSFGVVKGSGDWQMNYGYKEIESDAVPAVITDNEFHGGGTNGKGHTIRLTVGFLEKASLTVTFFQTEEITGDERKHDLLEIDVATTF